MQSNINERAKKAIYSLSNIPLSYLGKTYSDYLVKSKAIQMQQKITKAPSSGKLLVIGDPAPIINQLSGDRKVFGVDFVEYYESRFKDDDNPIPKTTEALLIYNVGAEPAKNPEYASKLLQSLIAVHDDKLVVIATVLTKTTFEATYGLTFVNSVTLKVKKEEQWI